MIVYEKSFWGLSLLSRLYGSAFPRALPAAVFSAAFTLVLTTLCQEDIEKWWINPLPYQTFSFIVGFVLVFRTQYSYQRYWEGCTQYYHMTSKWIDVTTMALTFDRESLPDSDSTEVQQKAAKFHMNFMHLMSLMHATACQGLRRDPNLTNLTPHSSNDPSPSPDPKHIDRTSFHHANGVALDSAVGQWHGWKDVFMLRASQGHLEKYNAAFPLPVIGNITPEEADALGCNSERNLKAYSVAYSCCAAHVQYMHRPNVVMTWIHELLVQRQRAGGLNVPPPVLTRVHQLLTEGITAYDHCRKIAAIPFPFPWAQFTLALLIAFTLTCPLIIVAYTRCTWLAVLLSTISNLAYWATNEVARDIEDPFLYEPNDLPMAKSQYDFNDTLIVIYNTRRPDSYIDLAPAKPCLSSPNLAGMNSQMSWRQSLARAPVVVTPSKCTSGLSRRVQ